MISDFDSLRYQHLNEQDVLRRVDELLSRLAELNATFEEDEVAADVAAAVAEARADDDERIVMRKANPMNQ